MSHLYFTFQHEFTSVIQLRGVWSRRSVSVSCERRAAHSWLHQARPFLRFVITRAEQCGSLKPDAHYHLFSTGWFLLFEISCRNCRVCATGGEWYADVCNDPPPFDWPVSNPDLISSTETRYVLRFPSRSKTLKLPPPLCFSWKVLQFRLWLGCYFRTFSALQ